MRALLPLALAALLLHVPAGSAGVGADDLLYDRQVAGSRAFGLKVTTGATGAYAFEIASNYLGGPYPGHVDSFGAWLYDGAKAFQFGIAVGGGVSQDRVVTRLGAGGLDGGALPEGVHLDDSGLDAGSMRFTIVTPPHSTRYVVAWAAGMHEARFRVWGPADTAVAVNEGPAYALGDAELADGGPNVQVQRSYAQFQYVGAKAMARTSATIAATQGAYGLWASHAFKQVCPRGFATPSCRQVDVAPACAEAEVSCDTARLSWQGPGGAGGTGSRAYNLLQHRGPGAYTFAVDHKLDAYGPWRSVGPAWVGLGEDTSLLALADVALPA